MSPRLVLAVAILWSHPAWAAEDESPPIVVSSFRNRCFDAAELGRRVRTLLPDAQVLLGTPPPGAHHLVWVSGDPQQLTVHLSQRNQRHKVVGSDERLLPLGDDCAAIAETAALIVVRAATPLAFRPPPPAPRRPPPPAPAPKGPSENRTVEPKPSEIRPSENRTGEPKPSENRTSENRTGEPRPSPMPLVAPPPPIPIGERRTEAPRRAHRLEIDVAAMWSFPLDGPPSTPRGELTVGWRWRVGPRLLVGTGLGAGVSGEWTASVASPEGPISVSARRIPLAAELRVDVEVPRARGVVRLAAGPEAVIWSASSTGLPRPGSALFAQPGAFLRVAYRLSLGPVVLQAGLELEVSFVRDDLTVGGVGVVAQTPLVLLSPLLGAGVGFF